MITSNAKEKLYNQINDLQNVNVVSNYDECIEQNSIRFITQNDVQYGLQIDEKNGFATYYLQDFDENGECYLQKIYVDKDELLQDIATLL